MKKCPYIDGCKLTKDSKLKKLLLCHYYYEECPEYKIRQDLETGWCEK